MYPFPYCRNLPGFWDGSCGNCKWPDAGVRCTLPGGRAIGGAPGPALPGPARTGGAGGGPRRRPALGTARNPLLIE
jgi:Protein of unknown function (DUF3716)